MTDKDARAGAGLPSATTFSSSVEVFVHYVRNAPGVFHVVELDSYNMRVAQLRTAMMSQEPPDGWGVDFKAPDFALCHVAEPEDEEDEKAVEAVVEKVFATKEPKAKFTKPLTTFQDARKLPPRFVVVGEIILQGRSAASSIVEGEMHDILGPLSTHAASFPLLKVPKRQPKGPASGFAPSADGKNVETLDCFMGNSCASVYWPPGAVNDLLTQIMTSRLERKWSTNAHHAVEVFQLLPRSLETVLKDSREEMVMDIQKMFNRSLGLWWPTKSCQILESGPVLEPLSISTGVAFCGGEVAYATAANPDFQATTQIKLRNGELKKICVCAGELKKSTHSTFEGLPQAEIAAVSALLTLRDLGLARKDCLVRFFSHTGLHEQHGVAYLLDNSFPCVTLTSRALSPMVVEDRELIVRFRAAAVTMASTTAAKLASITPSGGFALARKRKDWGILDPANYHIKRQFVDELFGSLQTSINHMLNVFSALMKERRLLLHVVFPVAILMQTPVGGDDTSTEQRPALVFDHIRGTTFHDVLKTADASVRTNALEQLKEVLCLLHLQGVVHMDLYPGNVMLQAASEGQLMGTVKVIDFDAAMFVGQLVPPIAKDILQRNGQMGIYHPHVFVEDAVVDVHYDWWLYAMMEAEAPFGGTGTDGRSLEEWKLLHQDFLLARVKVLIEQEKEWSQAYKCSATFGAAELL